MTNFYLKLTAEKTIPKLTVLQAYDGAEGLNIFRKQNIDVIITDYQMPTINGIELAKEIRKINSNVPIYLVSGLNIEEEDLQLFNGFIKKPVNLNIFEGFLKQVFKE
jgi:CheY-like chemotaxis protein